MPQPVIGLPSIANRSRVVRHCGLRCRATTRLDVLARDDLAVDDEPAAESTRAHATRGRSDVARHRVDLVPLHVAQSRRVDPDSALADRLSVARARCRLADDVCRHQSILPQRQTNWSVQTYVCVASIRAHTLTVVVFCESLLKLSFFFLARCVAGCSEVEIRIYDEAVATRENFARGEYAV